MSPAKPVLVIEDDPLIGQVIEAALEEAGFSVIWHELGRDGLDAAAALQPSVVLLDLMLPDLDGQEVLRELKLGPATSDIPVIVVSAVSATLTVEERQMIRAVVPKPFAIDVLVVAVRDAGTWAAG